LLLKIKIYGLNVDKKYYKISNLYSFPIWNNNYDHHGQKQYSMHNVFMHTRNLFFMEGYCVKCKQKRIMNDEKKITMKNGKPATQGICSTCGTKMFRIGK
jgi:RNase P subunit RPR2